MEHRATVDESSFAGYFCGVLISEGWAGGLTWDAGDRSAHPSGFHIWTFTKGSKVQVHLNVI